MRKNDVENRYLKTFCKPEMTEGYSLNFVKLYFFFKIILPHPKTFKKPICAQFKIERDHRN